MSKQLSSFQPNGFKYTQAKVLVIGGGGGGGDNGGGGGGAGGYQYNASYNLTKNSYSITVGNGGGANTNGQDSVFDTITATGGGAGGSLKTNGSNGGSGGGGGSSYNPTEGSGGTGSQGSNGGAGRSGVGLVPSEIAGGGGGGATSAGSQPTTAQGGTGGTGTSNSITGSAVVYSSGGAGGSGTTVRAGVDGGGSGGGGSTAATSGTANRGGGGGGGGNPSTGGASGGSGVVIISYPTGSITATGGTITTSGSDTIHTFTSSSTFTITSGSTKLYMPLNGSSVDISGNGNHGVDTSISYVGGKFGQGARFNGSSSVIKTGVNGLPTIQGSKTMSLWINTDLLPPSNNDTVIGLYDSATTPSSAVAIIIETPANSNYINVTKWGGGTLVNSNFKPKINNWYLVTYTYDGTNHNIYIDGVLKNTSTTVSQSGTSVANWLGIYPSGAVEWFNGILDEVIIENRAWTPQEITLYYRKSMLNYRPKSLFNLIKDFVMTGDTAVFTITGYNASLTLIQRLVAETANFIITGYDAIIRVAGAWRNNDSKSSSTYRNNDSKSSSTWTNTNKNS